MKYFIYILLFTLLTGCSASKQGKYNSNNKQYKLVATPLLVENDTVYVNELRFYKIKSILDSSHVMYNTFGLWDEKMQGFHQSNIYISVWRDVKLFPDSDEVFTIIADGTETKNDYHSCVMVFDSQSRDCLKDGHYYKDKLIDYFKYHLSKLKRKASIEKRIRKELII